MPGILGGKRAVLIDDSIVRATTSRVALADAEDWQLKLFGKVRA